MDSTKTRRAQRAGRIFVDFHEILNTLRNPGFSGLCANYFLYELFSLYVQKRISYVYIQDDGDRFAVAVHSQMSTDEGSRDLAAGKPKLEAQT